MALDYKKLKLEFLEKEKEKEIRKKEEFIEKVLFFESKKKPKKEYTEIEKFRRRILWEYLVGKD